MTKSYSISATQYRILTDLQRQVDAAQAALNSACTIVLAQYDVTTASPRSVEVTPDGAYVLMADIPTEEEA